MYLATGDVYRKDTIDRTHYPVFHQMEGFKILQEEINQIQDGIRNRISNRFNIELR